MSAIISGTFVFKLPSPISLEAEIKLFIDIKKREENLIAIVIDRNNNNVTIHDHIITVFIIIVRINNNTYYNIYPGTVGTLPNGMIMQSKQKGGTDT